jgi:hypothetical protein
MEMGIEDSLAERLLVVCSGVAKLRRRRRFFGIQRQTESLNGFHLGGKMVLKAGRRGQISVIVLVAFCGQLLAQNPQVKTRAGSRFPTVTFNSVLWTEEPAYYSIAVDAAGTATYQSAPESLERTGVPYTIEFHVSDRTRRTVFNLTRQLDYFRGEIQVQQASTAKDKAYTLIYRDLPLSTQLTYSGSSDSDVEELTSIFEEVSETLEYGRRLAFLQQHDRRKVAPELKALQADANRHFLRELLTIAPVLRNLAADLSLDPDTRRAAQSLADASLGQRSGFGGNEGSVGSKR